MWIQSYKCFRECWGCQTPVLCVSRLSCLSCTHSYPCILSSYCNTYFSYASTAVSCPHTPALRSDTQSASVHTRYQYVCGRGSADRLAATVKLAPFSYRCQVFCLAARGAGGELVSGVLGCRERQGRDGVICRVSLLAQPLGEDRAVRGPRGIRDSLVSVWAWKRCVMYRLHYKPKLYLRF